MSGKKCSAWLDLLNANSNTGGIRWFYGEENPMDFKVAYENRTTVLIHSSGKKLASPEHLSAAALAFPNCKFALHAPQNELPLLDGCATLWKNELNSIIEASGNLNFYIPKKDEYEIIINNRYLKYEKSDELEVEYAIDRFGQKYSASVKIKTVADLEKILSARTFIFEQELSEAKLSENLKGCGIILQSDGVNDLRFADEPAYHKILDFLGDITLYSNALPQGKFTIFNGGHELHHKCYGFFY
jgi:UDP-3-O-[3-hydroxymyristoyl] N-acetylglucosamine deacetylase